jgi:hypothetical protein
LTVGFVLVLRSFGFTLYSLKAPCGPNSHQAALAAHLPPLSTRLIPSQTVAIFGRVTRRWLLHARRSIKIYFFEGVGQIVELDVNSHRFNVAGKPTCEFCNSPTDGLPPAIPNTVCRAAACQEKYRARLVRQYRDEQTRQRELRHQHVSRVLQRQGVVEQGSGLSPSADENAKSAASPLPYFAVPANVRPLVELPTFRRNQFLAHLQQVTEAAFQIDKPPLSQAACADSESELPPPAAASVTSVVSAACGTCRGYCCRHGAHHAFFSQAHVQRLRDRHPNLTAAEVIDLIAGHLPQTSVEDSCVMHGPQGCELPRAYRAELCNHFECSDLVNIVEGVQTQTVLIAAIDGEQLVRQTMYSPSFQREAMSVSEPSH